MYAGCTVQEAERLLDMPMEITSTVNIQKRNWRLLNCLNRVLNSCLRFEEFWFPGQYTERQ